MRKLFYGISVVAMALGMVACDDSVSSANNEDADKESSSSVISEDASSSSVIPGSSSSVIPGSSSSVIPGSSSSVIPGSDPESLSSSSKKDCLAAEFCSSSSVTLSDMSSLGGDVEGSSSSAKSSSSVNSSSSIESSSSSSVTLSDVEGSSSSAVKVESSSSSRGLFDMTKDEFLNPKVSYGEMTDKRDYRKYKTVKIGTQVWMAENLNYADSTKMPSLKGKSWCYDNKAENCDVTGRLYTWAATIDSVALANDADNPQTCGYGKTCKLPTVVQGVCPEGWHLPSYDEWETLFTAVGGSSKAGTALKSQTGWYSQTGDAADRDAYGFSALPAGHRDLNGNIGNAGIHADFWSASQYENDSGSAYNMYLSYGGGNARIDDFNKKYAFSVRCLQNSN